MKVFVRKFNEAKQPSSDGSSIVFMDESEAFGDESMESLSKGETFVENDGSGSDRSIGDRHGDLSAVFFMSRRQCDRHGVILYFVTAIEVPFLMQNSLAEMVWSLIFVTFGTQSV